MPPHRATTEWGGLRARPDVSVDPSAPLEYAALHPVARPAPAAAAGAAGDGVALSRAATGPARPS
ncbi:hypothetical protein ACFY0R_11205 [Streptomyces sp. NPDC001633]|uniref:hypothetical protein n=1 Tax=Streptomyces sp. NPDC001633 TaxID=3364595 RepID=UPI0036A22907